MSDITGWLQHPSVVSYSAVDNLDHPIPSFQWIRWPQSAQNVHYWSDGECVWVWNWIDLSKHLFKVDQLIPVDQLVLSIHI